MRPPRGVRVIGAWLHAGASDDGAEGILLDGEAGLLPQVQVNALEERSATGQDDPAIGDVPGELRRRALQGSHDGVDDGVQGV